jgi:DNA-directed RNA polymerase subunit RPC12/RpoP
MFFLDRLFRRFKGKGIIRTDSKDEQTESSEDKQCAVCGEKVDEGLIQCPKCSSAVFTSSKKIATAPSISSVSGSTRQLSETSKQANLTCPNCGAEYFHEFMTALETIGLDKVTFSTSADPKFAFGKCQFCGTGLKPRGKPFTEIDLRKRD